MSWNYDKNISVRITGLVLWYAEILAAESGRWQKSPFRIFHRFHFNSTVYTGIGMHITTALLTVAGKNKYFFCAIFTGNLPV
jgi:hypothetical protein